MLRFAVIIAVLWTSGAHSQETVLSTRKLIDACTRADMHWVDFCNGFAQAAHDLAVVSRMACVPPGTSRTTLTTVFTAAAANVVEEKPEAGDAAGLIVFATIIQNTFPCR